MTKIKVGISRLYNANPCFISNGNSVCFNLQLPDMEIVASIGKDIRHLVRIWNFGPPTDTTGRQTTTKIQPRRIPGPDVFPADCYYEVEAIQWLEVDDELAALFNERDVTAREKIFVLLRAKKNEFYRSLDFTTVLFALRFHALIASVPITEQMYVYYTDCKEEAISTSLTINVTPLVQIDALNFSSNLVPARLSFTDFLGKGWTRASDTFSWLLKAWQAQDEVLKFVSLFTPLEMVIPALPDSKTAEWYLKREKIAQLIRDSDEAEKADLLKFMDDQRPAPPSLSERFRCWAADVRLAGWEKDIMAFPKFSRMRNLLLHQGESELELKVTVDAQDIRTLEDIAERYVSFALFGWTDIYNNKDRPAA